MWEATAIDGSTFEVQADDIRSWAQIVVVDHNGYDVLELDGDEVIGSMRFITDFPDTGFITIGRLVVDEGFRNRGVATALLARVHADYPGHKISPGAPASEGIGFIVRILEREPVVRQAGALIHPSVADL